MPNEFISSDRANFWRVRESSGFTYSEAIACTTRRLMGTLLLLTLIGGGGWGARPAAAQSKDAFRERRERMVTDFIEREGITNKKVLESMRATPRHEFVRPIDRPNAYQDGAYPIGHQQTISPPFIVAYMTEIIEPQPSDKVLEIGTGSGYQAAVLSPLVSNVYSIEIVEPLGVAAGKRLERLGYTNVKTKVGDGYKGWAEHAPFDKIIVTCSPEKIPQPLIEQLREGGRMIIPLGERYQQVFHLLEKKEGKLVQKRLIPTLFVPMTGISEDQRKVKPDPLRPRIVNGGFEEDDNEDGRPDGWHYQRLATRNSEEVKEGKYSFLFVSDEEGRIAQALQGTAIRGGVIRKIDVSCWAKTDGIVSGKKPFERAAVYIHFYDSIRRPIGDHMIGGWQGTRDWQKYSQQIRVPPAAREMIIRIGLNGATGKLYLDDLQMTLDEN